MILPSASLNSKTCLGLNQSSTTEIQAKRPIQLSYVYYPLTKEFPFGHAELEINGTCWSLQKHRVRQKDLNQMIQKSKRNGSPFFRFPIIADQEAIKKLQDDKVLSCICSVGVFDSLSRSGCYWVPRLFRLSPLISALYLSAAKFFGSTTIGQIEIYWSSDKRKNIKNCLEGCLNESILISLIIIIVSAISKNIFRLIDVCLVR